jgi:hypothetical protein
MLASCRPGTDGSSRSKPRGEADATRGGGTRLIRPSSAAELQWAETHVFECAAVTVPESPLHQWRLRKFCRQNPCIVITREARLGFWQAWIPASNGGTVITRYTLQDLLDKLEGMPDPNRASPK